MGLSLSRVSRHFCLPLSFHSFVRPAPPSILPPRPHISIAVAARRLSRTALLQRRRRLVLDGREHGGRLPAIGWLARATIRGEPAIGRDQTRTTLVFG